MRIALFGHERPIEFRLRLVAKALDDHVAGPRPVRGRWTGPVAQIEGSRMVPYCKLTIADEVDFFNASPFDHRHELIKSFVSGLGISLEMELRLCRVSGHHLQPGPQPVAVHRYIVPDRCAGRIQEQLVNNRRVGSRGSGGQVDWHFVGNRLDGKHQHHEQNQQHINQRRDVEFRKWFVRGNGRCFLAKVQVLAAHFLSPTS
jgi:hypothetical protein